MPGVMIQKDEALSNVDALKANVQMPEGKLADLILNDVEAAATKMTLSTAELEANLEILLAAAQNKKNQDARANSMKVFELVCKAMTPETEARLASFNSTVLTCLADEKSVKTREAADLARTALLSKLNPHGIAAVYPTMLEGLNSANKWRVKVASLESIKALTTFSPLQVARALHLIFPSLQEPMYDAKPEVVKAAESAVEAIFGVIDNRDVDPFVPALISSMKNLDEVPECIQQLASTTFVQTVDAATLSVIVPLLLRGFSERQTAVQRQAAVIIKNMSKLVEEPHECSPFLEDLLPALQKSAEAMSNPEARDVITGVREQLLRIQASITPRDLTIEMICENIKKAANKATEKDTKYAAELIMSLCVANNFEADEWNKILTPFFKHLVSNVQEFIENTRVFAFKHMGKEVEEEVDDAEKLCDTKFTLAYGSKVLLHNTQLKLLRGHRYGLLGGNDSGKTTLMRAIANGQLDGFPSADVVRTVFVEADIQGELSHLSCVDYIFEDPRIQAFNVNKDEIKKILLTVGFSEKMSNDNVNTLSGGWRMKLALSRAMLQKADVLLLDEPTNHLDVINVAWVMSYLNSLTTTTSIIVSHDSKLLDQCCTDILQIEDLKLKSFKGNLSDFVARNPNVMSFFEIKSDKVKFNFPQPGFLPGVKSKGKPLMKMDKVTFTYPGNAKPTISDITVRVSLASRVACVGVNGAGKSTMIKLLTGELEPQVGLVWKHDAARIGYIAQHAFHHIEQHLNKTPNEYIRWRYDGGEDKEGLNKATMVLTPEEEEKLRTPITIDGEDNKGKAIKIKRTFESLTGTRRALRTGFEYEVRWEGLSHDSNTFMKGEELEKMGAGKHTKLVDSKIQAAEGLYQRPLTQANVEKHLEDVGLDREFGSHHRMSALSGGQKVKVVLAAAMWNQPHILILDEPTNYLDRDSLGALSKAIEDYEGGVVMITHNNDFCSKLCPETWVLENGLLNCKGDADWMKNQDTEIKFEAMDEMVDAQGNTQKVKAPKTKMTRQQKKAYQKLKAAARARGEDVSDDEE